MPARQRNPRTFACGPRPANHLPRRFDGQFVDGPAQNGNGHQRFTPHGVDVGERVDRGDFTKIESIVYDGRKKIGR